MIDPKRLLCFAALSVFTSLARAQNPIRLQEPLSVGTRYHVSTRLKLSGELKVPLEPGKPAENVTMSGSSAVEYDERILEGGVGDKPSPRTLRVYRRCDINRKVGDVRQEASIRTGVQRMVIMRTGHREVPFSPDGPLTWGELDLVRTDVFTPALASLLPNQLVRPGDRWTAGSAAVEELTDLEKVDAGKLECKFEEVTSLANRKLARIRLSGMIQGVSEDGPTRHQLDGYFYFDLTSNHISYVSLDGVQTLLDKDQRETGQVRGQFVLTREYTVRPEELSDDVVRTLSVEPNAENTLLYYENTQLGVRFLHPRRWRIGVVTGQQIAIDDVGNPGNGILLTSDVLARIPNPADYAKETEGFLAKQKGRILKTEQAQKLANPPAELDRFGYEAELQGQRVRLEYYIARQPSGGATLAARLTTNDLANTLRDVERIARSVRVDTRPPSGK